MKEGLKQTNLKKELRRLFRAMDFISSQFKNNTHGKKDVRAYYDVYQLLGSAWEFLSLRCDHREGYKRTRNGENVCRICGTIKGTKESYILLPYSGLKCIGQKKRPNSKEIFAAKKKAQITKDTIVFHGATLDVDVHNAYKKRLRQLGKPINIAADRTVTLKERDVECSVDDFMITVRLSQDKRSPREPEYGAFPWELKKDHLRNFPILSKFNRDHKLRGLSILSGVRESRRKRPRTLVKPLLDQEHYVSP